MASPIKTKKILRKIYYHRHQLQKALNEAHDNKVIVYENYAEESPCATLYKTADRIDETTKSARAEAFKREIINGLKY